MNRNLRSLLCLGWILCAAGCTETRSYSLYVKNQLDSPVTICTTKTRGPQEWDWISPEELATPPHPANDNRPPGLVIFPGKTAHRELTGEFIPNRGQATLRVYAGTPNLSEMNAIDQGSINRLDLPMFPGLNTFEIDRGPDGKMAAAPFKLTTK